MSARSGASVEAGSVEGERGIATVFRRRSLRTRLTQLLPLALVVALGSLALVWYYTTAAARARQAPGAPAAAARRADPGDAALPPLDFRAGPADSDAGVVGDPADAAESPDAASADDPGPGEEPTEVPAPIDVPRLPRRLAQAAPAGVDVRPAIERQFGGSVYVRAGTPASAGTTESPGSVSAGPAPEAADPAPDAPRGASLPRVSPYAVPARARALPERRLLLERGTFVDCTLETAIDSSLAGLVTCVTAADTFGSDGAVVLLERGTRLVGETRGEVRLGGSRLFVLWTEARTPDGVVVPLESPATDQLGRSGVTGSVDRHFMDRFGAALLISTVDGLAQAAASRRGGSGTVVVDGTGSRDVVTEILRETVALPPTLRVAPGSRLQALVARDIDFRGVYELRTHR